MKTDESQDLKSTSTGERKSVFVGVYLLAVGIGTLFLAVIGHLLASIASSLGGNEATPAIWTAGYLLLLLAGIVLAIWGIVRVVDPVTIGSPRQDE